MNFILLPALTYCLSTTPAWFNSCNDIAYVCDNYSGEEMQECVENHIDCVLNGEKFNFCKEWINE